MRVRVVTYNVRGFRAGVDRVAAAVRDLEPDVLLLQETGPRRRLRGFAEAMEMSAAADPLSPFRRRVKDAVLSTPPWVLVAHRHRRFSRGSRSMYPRGATVATLARAEGRLTAVSIHLGLSGAERAAHARELLTDLRDEPAPVVLGGDLNATSEHRAAELLSREYPDVWVSGGEGPGPTMPAASPVARIDFIFASQGMKVLRAWVGDGAGVGGDSGASDHLPVCADLVV